jgi:predicted CXXCH cytochrome family protein
MLVAMFSIVASAAGSTPGTAPGDHGGVYNGQVSDDTGNDNSYNTIDKSNANQTGSGVGGQTANFNQVIKSDDMIKADGTKGTQRTHGEYMNNTNSCASCHQTHTGAGASLLFKNGEYATCSACHDGTLGFYNVMGAGSDSAGTFGGTHDGNMSAHLANGTVKLSAAPGGNNSEVTGIGGEWDEEFTCANCHAPHGSYSSRLLHEDPNGMANALIQDGGQKVENVPVVNVADFSATTKVAAGTVTYTSKDAETAAAVGEKSYNFIVVRYHIGDTLPAALTNADVAAKGITGTGDAVLQLMKWVPTLDEEGTETGGVYKIDTNPWIHEYDFDSSHTKHDWTAFYDATNKFAADYADTKWQNQPKEMFDTDQLKKGAVYGAGFAGIHKDDTKYPGSTTLIGTVDTLTNGKIARGYVVKLVESAKDANNVTTTDVTKLWASTAGGKGVAVSTWCASCHTDYLASSGKESGTFDHAYRHTTTSDSYTCVRCHYAHGTDVTIMRDARGLTYNQIMADTTNYPFTGATDRTAAVKDYLLDKNPSSVLKRYTNMAVCWGCHTSSHSGGTRNTDSFQYNTTPGVATDRNGIDGSVTPNTPNAGY